MPLERPQVIAATKQDRITVLSKWPIGLLVPVMVCGSCVHESESILPMASVRYGQPNPDAPDELSQFAFLIGSWKCDVRVKRSDGSDARHRAVWTARYILDGRVIADEYRETLPDGKLIRYGSTYRSYDAEQGTWVMKWHDALTSQWLDLGTPELGGVEVDASSISFKHHVPPDGIFRCTFSDICDHRFTWTGELSTDGGASWDKVMEIRAHRVKG